MPPPPPGEPVSISESASFSGVPGRYSACQASYQRLLLRSTFTVRLRKALRFALSGPALRGKHLLQRLHRGQRRLEIGHRLAAHGQRRLRRSLRGAVGVAIDPEREHVLPAGLEVRHIVQARMAQEHDVIHQRILRRQRGLEGARHADGEVADDGEIGIPRIARRIHRPLLGGLFLRVLCS